MQDGQSRRAHSAAGLPAGGAPAPPPRDGDTLSPIECDDSLLSMISRMRFELPSISGCSPGYPPLTHAPPPDYYASEATHHSFPSISPFSPYLQLTWISPGPKYRSTFSHSDPMIGADSIHTTRSSTQHNSNSYPLKSPFHPHFNNPVSETEGNANPLLLVADHSRHERLSSETPRELHLRQVRILIVPEELIFSADFAFTVFVVFR